MTIGAYPGTFNPPTVAHLAIAEAARRHAGLDRVDLVVSESPLGKQGVQIPSLADRIAVLQAVARARDWLGVLTTPAQLLVDVAAGYDVVIMGADKWAQVIDPAWYGCSEEARDRAVERLPAVLVVPRPPFPLPSPRRPRLDVLTVAEQHLAVSSSEVRAGRHEWMAREAAAFDEQTGAWSDPDRYRQLRGLS